jgi:hypothetical protein
MLSLFVVVLNLTIKLRAYPGCFRELQSKLQALLDTALLSGWTGLEII